MWYDLKYCHKSKKFKVNYGDEKIVVLSEQDLRVLHVVHWQKLILNSWKIAKTPETQRIFKSSCIKIGNFNEFYGLP